MKKLDKTLIAISLVALSVVLTTVAQGSSAGGATKADAQIASLQKKVAGLHAQISEVRKIVADLQPPKIAYADIFYYTLTPGCKYPADPVTTVPIPSTTLCHLKVAYTDPVAVAQ